MDAVNQCRKGQHFTGICASTEKNQTLQPISNQGFCRAWRRTDGTDRVGREPLEPHKRARRVLPSEHFSSIQKCGLIALIVVQTQMPLEVFPQDMPKANTQFSSVWSSLTRSREAVKIFPLAWKAGIESHLSYFWGHSPGSCVTVFSSFLFNKVSISLFEMGCS